MAPAPLGLRRRVLVAVILGVTLASTAHAAAPLALLAPPDWAELPTDTQAILAPLGPEWNQIESPSRRKWLQIAERYPKMGREEQARIQRRMRDWAKLTPAQRKAAREKYQNVRQATPEQREALKQMWLEYQALPEDEKGRFRKPAGGAAK